MGHFSWEADNHSANKQIPNLIWSWNPKIHYNVQKDRDEATILA